jgi:hypothetical protein
MSRGEKVNMGFTAYDQNFDIKIGSGKLLLVTSGQSFLFPIPAGLKTIFYITTTLRVVADWLTG